MTFVITNVLCSVIWKSTKVIHERIECKQCDYRPTPMQIFKYKSGLKNNYKYTLYAYNIKVTFVISNIPSSVIWKSTRRLFMNGVNVNSGIIKPHIKVIS